MGRGNRAYKSAKRNKELQRLKKQEEKRLRRLGKLKEEEETAAAGAPAGEGPEPEVDLAADLGLDVQETESQTPGSDKTSDD